MNSGIFADVAATNRNPNWGKLSAREGALYNRDDEVRSPYARDYTRILHSLAYRRLKHKTQVFFNIDNDHICTRMEHVAHVESVSSTIAKYLGLNDELTKAISIGHDIGHAPFGHHGEQVLNRLTKTYLRKTFWHEKNGLRFVDEVELLENDYRSYNNLSLTYAVRDGIIAHCGEIDENGLKPREEFIDLKRFSKPGKYQPITWEGCVVKISDKIAYIGRDIEDAICLGFLNDKDIKSLEIMARENDQKAINTTAIMHNLIADICQNSSPDKGICLSNKFYEQISNLKELNGTKIYKHKRLKAFKDYSKMIIENIFETLLEAYDGEHIWGTLDELKVSSATLVDSFTKWLARYCDTEIIPQKEWELRALSLRCENKKIYGSLDSEDIYIQAVLDYIAGMTDRFAIKIFNELLVY